jgi:hypothetical protein
MVSASTMTPPARTAGRLPATRTGAFAEPRWRGWRPNRLGGAAVPVRVCQPPLIFHGFGVGVAPMLPSR